MIETLNFDKFGSADLNCEDSFSKKKMPQNSQIQHLWSQILNKSLHLHKFEGADFKYVNTFSKLYAKNTHIRHFGSQTFNFFVLQETLLQFDKFEVTDFNYETNFQNCYPKIPK